MQPFGGAATRTGADPQREVKQQHGMLLSMSSTGPGQGPLWLWDKRAQGHKSRAQAELRAEMAVVSLGLHCSQHGV